MDYRNALETAILYIEKHLGDAISVEDVARAAGYSYYHITRQFSAVLGESVGSYIKKRRLADGAKKLPYTDKRILDIAVENGFESSEAFSRAFKALYGVSPRSYRTNRLDLLIASKDELNPQLLEHRLHQMTVHPKIVKLPDIKATGIRGQTTLNDNVLPQLWAQFRDMVHKVPGRVPNARGFGICESCSEGNNLFHNMSRDVLFGEVAAVEVDSFEGIVPPFVPKVLSGGRYAVFTHRGNQASLMDTFGYIWGTWLFNTAETVDSREDFELYDDRFLGFDHPDSEMDIYIPLTS